MSKPNETQRLRSFAKGLSERGISEISSNVSMTGRVADTHAPHGERGDFLKVTATLSPEVYELLNREVLRRKLAREPNAQLSAVLREAVLVYLAPTRV